MSRKLVRIASHSRFIRKLFQDSVGEHYANEDV